MTTTFTQKVQNYGENYAAGVATALIGKLGELLVDEYLLLSRVRGEVVELRDDAAMMNAIFRMLSETDDGAVSHFILEWMKQVRELSYDAEDCIDLFADRITWGPPVAGPLGRTWHWIDMLWLRHRLADDIKSLRARAIAIGERRVQYGISRQEMPASVAFGSRILTLSTPPLFGTSQSLVGDIDNKVNDLSERVKSGATLDGDPYQPTDPTLKVYSILGAGGVGKSTLALEVFRKIKGTFHCNAIVRVSHDFQTKDLAKLMKNIYDQLGYTPAAGAATTIQDFLNSKR